MNSTWSSNSLGATQARPIARTSLRRQRLIIIGNGMVGHRLCERLATAGAAQQFEIIVFAEEARPAYDRVNLGEVLRGRDEGTLTLAPFDWYKQCGISLHLRDPIVGVDTVRQQVRSSSGMTLGFDHLVLATGSSPVIPRLDLAEANPDGLFTLRTWEDATRLRAGLHEGSQAIILGGGFIGLETADALAHQGLDVMVIEAGAQLLPGRLDPQGATLLRRLLQQRGVRFRLGERVAAVRRAGAERQEVVLSSGERVLADMVIVATGVRPRDDLARVAGLGVGPMGGVTVNGFLQTSHPRVYAIGECAAAPGVRPGHVAPGFCMADAVARTILGEPTAFQSPTQPVSLKVPRLEVFFVDAGMPADGEDKPGQDQSFVASGRESFRKVVLSGRRIVAAQAVGDWSETSLVTQAVTAHLRVGRTATWRFRHNGKLWPKGPSGKASPAPQTAADIVCACAAVPLGSLQAAVDGGCHSLDEVRRCTGAAAGCGACIPAITNLLKQSDAAAGIAQPRAQPPRLSVTGTTPARGENIGSAPLSTTSPAYRALRLLGALSLLAIAGSAVLASGVAGVRGLPLLEKLTAGRWPFALWTLPSLQNLTGWGLVGLYLLGSSLPLWKRWGSADSRVAVRRRRRARVLHAGLGLIIITGGIVHTGGRAGANLNACLAVAASCLLALGGAAALTPNSTTSWWRIMRRLHLIVLWPVLALIAIHLYAVLSF